MSPRKRAAKTSAEANPPHDEIVIERPEYDETVICSVAPGRWPAFEAIAREWWTAPTQLSLLTSETVEQRHVREISSFHDAMRVSGFGNDAYPPRIEVTIETKAKAKGRRTDTARPPRRVSPPAVRGSRVTIATTLGRRAIAFALAGATELGERWTDEARDSIVMRDGGSVAEVVLVRPMAMLKRNLSERERGELAEAHRRWREIDQVTLDLLVNNVVDNEADDRGWWYISYDQMLDARGLEKRRKTEKREGRADLGATYSAGHRSEDREEQHQSVLRVVNMGALVGNKARRRRGMIPPTIEDHGFEYDFVSGSATGVWYELGAWVDALALRSDPRIPAVALTYDPYREVLESRLARLLTILLANEPSGIVKPTVGDVVREIRAPFSGPNVGRQILRFHKALDSIQRDGIIGAWKLQPSLAEEPLPPRGFIDDWMVRKLLVYRSPPVLTGRSIPDVIV
jgi:hypothetical protein